MAWMRITVLGLVALALAGCSGGLSQTLGLGKRAPDEFAVVRQQPLVIPPDFQLRPPQAGETRPAAGSPGERVRANLTGQPVEPQLGGPATAASNGGASAGTSALLARTNRTTTDPEIRSRIDQDTAARAETEDSLFGRLLDWEPSEPQDAAVDASAEAERLSTNRAEGRPVTDGETPIVVRRDQTPLGELVERVF